MINDQQKLFLQSLLEEHRNELNPSDQMLTELSKLVNQKIQDGISFHLAAHQAVNELIVIKQESQQSEQAKTPRYYYWLGAVLSLIFISFIGFLLFKNKVKEQTPTLFPISEQTYSQLSANIHPNNFQGVNIAVQQNSEINATGAGEVIMVEKNAQLGNSIVIRHNEQYKTVYGYLAVIHVKEGDWVNKGQIIGRTGMSQVAQAPLLHYAIIENEQFIDPILYMKNLANPNPGL